jgi:F-type H+-transporting ATPase subunit b
MLIDWFTVIAQVVNFLILVWLLKHFLYRPILDAIDAREKRIARELADADAKKAEARKERDEFQHKNEEFDQQRSALMNKVTEEAKTERQRLLDEARQAADALSAKRYEALQNDAHNLNQAISRRTQQEVFAIARKALTDLAAASLEERLAEVFTRRLREMDEQAKRSLGEAIKTASEPALVRSAFDLPAAQRTAIQQALNQAFSAEIPIRFETAPELISGIELTANGQKVAWSIADYLVSLEKGVAELLKEKEQAEAQAQARAQAKKPSVLTQQIGQRAYELYEEHGHKAGHAAEDWEQAEHEIRKEILRPVKTGPKAEIKPRAKANLEPEAEAKPEDKVAHEPASKVDPVPEGKSADKVGSKPAAKDAPGSAAKAEAKPATEAEPKPEGKPVAKPEATAETEPEKKSR